MRARPWPLPVGPRALAGAPPRGGAGAGAGAGTRIPARAGATAFAFAVASALAALAVAPTTAAARPDEQGNLAVPDSLPKEVAERYRAAVAQFEKASEGREGATKLAEAAAEELRQVVKLAPDFAPPRYYLGIIYQWTKEFERARSILHQAVGASSRFHEAFVELGDTYVWLGKPERARTFYDKALEVKPDYALAWLRRGQLSMRGGDFPAAKSDLEQARKTARDEGGRAEATALLGIVEEEISGPKWAATFVGETKNYRVLTPVDQALADHVSRHAELIFKTYKKMFPEVSRDRRKFTIVVYGSKEEYHRNGGPQGAGGHYSPLVRKLVLFRYPEEKDTLLVLYHEAFHQFLHDYLEDAPQWLNEGLGDFFGPSQYVETKNARGKVIAEAMRFRTNPWRLRLIKEAIRAGRVRGWRELMLMSQQEMYEPQWAGIHYAEAWSIVYFLVRYQAKDDEIAGPYFPLLGAYFERLRKGDGQEGAFEAAFGKQDMKKLEDEWKAFVLGLKGDGD